MDCTQAGPRRAAGRLYTPVMDLLVNGEPKRVPDGATVADLLREVGLEGSPCAVEVNRVLVPKARHAQTPLQPADSVEVVTLVGGG